MQQKEVLIIILVIGAGFLLFSQLFGKQPSRLSDVATGRSTYSYCFDDCGLLADAFNGEVWPPDSDLSRDANWIRSAIGLWRANGVTAVSTTPCPKVSSNCPGVKCTVRDQKGNQIYITKCAESIPIVPIAA